MEAYNKYNVSIFRINLSHGNTEQWSKYFKIIEEVRNENEKYRNAIKLMGDI